MDDILIKCAKLGPGKGNAIKLVELCETLPEYEAPEFDPKTKEQVIFEMIDENDRYNK